jgi:hypothetical protein
LILLSNFIYEMLCESLLSAESMALEDHIAVDVRSQFFTDDGSHSWCQGGREVDFILRRCNGAFFSHCCPNLPLQREKNTNHANKSSIRAHDSVVYKKRVWLTFAKEDKKTGPVW